MSLTAEQVIAARSDWWFARIASAFSRYTRRHFTAVRIASWGLPPDGFDPAANGNVAVASNHPGWWDPIVFVLLHRRFFPHHWSFGPMDAAALKQYPLFTKLGIFGIAPDSTQGARDFLRVARGVFATDKACLWVTVPGRFQDNRDPIDVRPGLVHALCASGKTALLPLAIEYVFWDQKLPELLVAFGAPVPVTDRAATQAALETGLRETVARLGDSARRRDPNAFITLWTGQPGVGGIYDWGRRLRAWLKRERFSADHVAAVETRSS